MGIFQQFESNIRRLQLLTCLPGMVVLLLACEQKPLSSQQERLRPVSTMVVEKSARQTTRSFVGVAKAETRSRLSFTISGRLDEVSVQVGQSLEKNQLIAKLNKEDYALELQKAEAALNQARVEATNNEINYNRIAQLYKKGIVSRTEYDNARTIKDSALATVAQSEKQVELASQRLAYTELNVEMDNCLVASVDVEVGENVSAGTPVATVNCGNTTNVEVAVPETFISSVTANSKVEVSFNAFPNRPIAGSVIEVGVDAAGTAFPVTVALQQSDTRILPGMAATVSFIQTWKGEAGIVLPAHVIQSDDQGTFVYRVKPVSDDVAVLQRQSIETYFIDAPFIEVTSGLKNDDVIVTKGINHLHDGMRVRYQSGQTPAQG